MKEVSNEKIDSLRDIILESANSEKKAALTQGRREADEWIADETEKLQQETDMILQDAKKRSEDIKRRQILSAEREKATETLRLQNRLLSDAMGMLQDKLVHLRGREDYKEILTGMCIDAIESLGTKDGLSIRFSATDLPLAEPVEQKLHEIYPDASISFSTDPAPILGGCWVSTADGQRQVNMDWQNITQEMADSLAERLLPLL